MKDGGELPKELVWDGAHVSELALTAMADGEERALGARAVEHVESCEWCAGRLGRAALLSSAVGAALADRETGDASAGAMAGAAPPVRAGGVSSPGRALVVAVAVALLTAAPFARSLLRALYAPGSEVALAVRSARALARSGLALAASGAVKKGMPAATLVASALLVLLGWAVARWVSRETPGAAPAERSAS
jgi:hypothetical protein